MQTDNVKISREELAKLVQTPLDPDLDYFDATGSIEAMAEHIRGLHKLITFMFQSLGIQGAAIIDMRTKMVEHKDAIELLAGIVAPEDDSGKLVGLDPPELVGFDTKRKPN